MYRHKIWNTQFNRRTFIIKSVFSLATLGLMGRLSYLQLYQHYRYKLLSDKNRIKIFLSESIRGDIVDCNGLKLATNLPYYEIIYEPERFSDILKIKTFLKKLFNLTDQELIKITDNPKGNEKYIIKNNATWEDIKKAEFYILELPGVYVILKYKRYYPLSNSCAHFIGYLSPSNSSEFTKIGKSGLEQIFEEKLRGSPGIIQREVNSKGAVIRDLENSPPIPGQLIQTTIDSRIQKFSYDILTTKGSGAIVILDIKTGNIITAANYPSYDNNIFSSSLPEKEWKNLTEETSLPLINRAFALKISPGSIFKVVAALAGLETKLINPSTQIHCPGYTQFGDRKFRCARKYGHGLVNLHEAITQSCNVYFYELAKILPINEITNIAKLLGLGSVFNLGFPEESKGLIPDNNWRKCNLKKWYLGDTVNVIIGQGYISTTPLQLAVLVARIASGKAVIPNFQKISPNFLSLGINNIYLNSINYSMFSVINSPKGTAFSFRSLHQNIAGKTGTIQLKSSKSSLNPVKNHAAFIGYSDFNRPHTAISVVLEHGVAGSQAALIGCQVLDYIHKISSLN